MRSLKAFAATLSLVLVLCVTAPGNAQTIRAIQFKNQPISDILLALGRLSEQSIVPDATVTGNASYYFENTTLDNALTRFLSAYHYYYWVKDGVYYVSKVRTEYDPKSRLVSLDADSAAIRSIIGRLSKSIGETVLFDGLPNQRITLHVRKLKPLDVLKIIAARFPQYEAVEASDYLFLKRIPPKPTGTNSQSSRLSPFVTRSGDTYSINAKQMRFRVAIESLFRKAGREYLLLGNNNQELHNLYFTDKSFTDLLRLLLEQGQSDFAQVGKVYYIYDTQKRDVLKQFESTVVLPLSYISASSLPTLLPPDIASASNYKIDQSTNSVILSGSLEQIGPIQRFIERLDRPLQGQKYYRFDLSYMDVQTFLKALPKQLSPTQPISIQGENSFIMLLSPQKQRLIRTYIGLVDRPNSSVPVRLNYITSTALLKDLPPGIDKSNIVQSGDPNLVFFTGSQDKQQLFLKELEAIDHPVPQIKYELLVIQYQNGQQFNRELTVSNSVIKSGDQNAFLGAIGKLLNLNFDIVSAFGYLFALNLNLNLSNSKARVLADTTLNGLSGQQIKFQNTDTYRYRESIVNPDTGKLDPTGVVREITSGLIVGIKGSVSGNNTITMNISATISKQGANTSGGSSTLPPTSEKIINTDVRTSAGKPVVIGGLVEQDSTNQIDKTPGLGDIPWVGGIFRKNNSSQQNTELTVYILPEISYSANRRLSEARELKNLYSTFVEGGSNG